MEFYPLTLLTIIIASFSLVYIFFKRKFAYWSDRGVKYFEPRIPLGNLPFGRYEHLKTIFGNIYALKDKSPFIGGYIFTNPVVVATDLDFVQDILVRDFHNFHERGVFNNEKDEPLSAHLFSLDGQRWKSLRMKLSPTFTSGKMKFMFPTMVDVAEKFCEALTEVLHKESIHDVKDLLARFTTDVIGTCAFGLECNSLKDPDNDFRKYGRLTFELRLGIIGRGIVMQFPEVAKFLHMKIFREDVTEFFMRIVRETVDYRRKNNVKRNDFMNLLIELMDNVTTDNENNVKLDKLTIEQVTAQAFLFFAAGFETSSTAMTFSLYEMALNPHIQQKARKEVNDVLNKHDGNLTYEAVKEMVYIDQVINESLRKYPPVVTLRRNAHDDYKVKNSNVVIQKGQTVVIPVYGIHHDSEYYPNPEKFDPDRFTSDQIKNRHPMAFLPFGDGPRNCIGLRFGRMQARIGLIMLLKNFNFKVCSKTPIPMEFSKTIPTLSPANGLHLKIERI